MGEEKRTGKGGQGNEGQEEAEGRERRKGVSDLPCMACNTPLCMDLMTPFSSNMSYKFLPTEGPTHHLTCLSTPTSADEMSIKFE